MRSTSRISNANGSDPAAASFDHPQSQRLVFNSDACWGSFSGAAGRLPSGVAEGRYCVCRAAGGRKNPSAGGTEAVLTIHPIVTTQSSTPWHPKNAPTGLEAGHQADTNLTPMDLGSIHQLGEGSCRAGNRYRPRKAMHPSAASCASALKLNIPSAGLDNVRFFWPTLLRIQLHASGTAQLNFCRRAAMARCRYRSAISLTF